MPSMLPAGPGVVRLARRLLTAFALLLAGGGAAGHDVPSEMKAHALVKADGTRLQVAVRLPLVLLMNVDLPKRGDNYLDLGHVESAFPRALDALGRGIVLYENGEVLTPRGGEARIALPSDRAFESFGQAAAAIRGDKLPTRGDVYWNQGWFDALLEYPVRADGSGSYEIEFLVAPGLRDRLKLDLRFELADGRTRAFALAPGEGRAALDPRWYQAAIGFVVSGFEHILDGPDHLLFLLCLIVPYRRLGWSLVGVLTAFTAAHSVTLIAAAYGHVPEGDWFPPFVETVIALSIIYMAIENLLRPRLQWRWIPAALFGLVHGFGFSFALGNELQFAGDHLLLSLLAFNVGVELGQLLVLVIVFPVLWWIWQRWAGEERIITALITAFVAHTAWHWTTERWEALSAAEPPWVDGIDPGPWLAWALLAVLAAGAFYAWRRRAGYRPVPERS